MKLNKPVLILNLVLPLTLALLSGCAEDDKASQFNIDAYNPVGEAEAAALSDSDTELVGESMFQYFYSPSDEAKKHDEKSLWGVMDQIKKQVREVDAQPEKIDADILETSICQNGGVQEISGKIESEISKKEDEDSKENSTVEYFLQASGEKKLQSCSFRLFDDPSPAMSGTVTSSIKLLVDGKRVASETEDLKFDSDQSDYAITFETSFDGSFTRDSDKQKVAVKDFGLAAKLSKEEVQDMKEISADPLGDEAIDERRAEWFRKNLLCKGEVIVNDKTYPCESVVSYYINKR